MEDGGILYYFHSKFMYSYFGCLVVVSSGRSRIAVTSRRFPLLLYIFSHLSSSLPSSFFISSFSFSFFVSPFPFSPPLPLFLFLLSKREDVRTTLSFVVGRRRPDLSPALTPPKDPDVGRPVQAGCKTTHTRGTLCSGRVETCTGTYKDTKTK